MTQDLESIASQLLIECGLPTPCDTAELALRLGLWLCAGNRLDGVRIIGDDTIYYDERLPGPAQDREIAFALGQWALRRAGVEITEDRARYVADVLLYGGSEVTRDLVPACMPAILVTRKRRS